MDGPTQPQAQQPQGPGGATNQPAPPSASPPDTTQQSTRIFDPAVQQMSFEEYKQKFGQINPQEEAKPSAEGTPAPAPQPPPVHSFLQKLSDVAKRTSLGDIGKSLLRGVIETGTGLGQTIEEGAAYADRKTGLGEKIQPGFNAAYDQAGGARGLIAPAAKQTQDVIDKYLPVHDDDTVAHFAESASQFTTGFLASGELKAFSSSAKLAQIAENPGTTALGKALLTVLRGGAVDATVFDPAQAGLAELAAKAPVPIVKQVGDLLSVKGDDNAVVARLKRAAAGAIPASVLEGIISSARMIRSGKALADGAAGAEKQAAVEQIQSSASTLQDVKDGTHTTPDQHVIARPNEDGSATLAVNPQSPVGKQVASEAPATVQSGGITYHVEGYRGVEPGRALDDPGHGGAIFLSANKESASDFTKAHGVEGEGTLGHGQVELKNPLMMQSWEGVPTGQAEADFINEMRDKGHDGIILQKGMDGHQEIVVFNPKSVKFDGPSGDAAEIATQAETINHAINGSPQAARSVSPDELENYRSTVKTLLNSNNPEDIQRLTDGTHFNLNYFNGSDALRAHVEALSDVIGDELDAAQKSGGVSWEDSFDKARRLISSFSEDEAPKALAAKLGQQKAQSVWSLASDMVMKDIGQKLSQLSAVMDSRPGDVAVEAAARKQLSTYFDLAKKVAGNDSEVGRTLQLKQARGTPEMDGVSYKADGVEPASNGAKAPKTQPPEDLVAGMKTRDVQSTLRMIRMAGGEPQNTYAVVKAATAMQKNPTIRGKILEYFMNVLLSNPLTHATIASTNATLSNFEPIVRMATGLVTGNRQMMQEGADIMWGNWKYVGDNLRAARATLNSGQSLIDPMPSQNQIGGLTGQIVRTPGNSVGAIDEFTKNTNYRSYIRAQSLKIARSQGLEGAALEQRVEDDLRASYTDEGIARVPAGLQYARKTSLLSPLEGGEGKSIVTRVGAGLQDFTNNVIEAKYILPFIRFGTNMWDYVWQSTPGLNLLNAESRATMRAGGEQAAMLHTRSVMAGMVYAMGMYGAMNGDLTGGGPHDPNMRAAWLKNNQPYSIRIGDHWISYKKSEPLSLPLGLIADAHTAIRELSHKPGAPDEASKLVTSIVASIASNMSSESNLSGMTNFMSSWSENDPNAMERWLEGFGSSLVVPKLVQDFNNDDTMRETRGFADKIISQIPGWSKTLDPKYNGFGEPQMYSEGAAQHHLNPFKVSPVGHSEVEDAMLKLGKALPSPSQRLGINKDIDLTDKTKWASKGQPSPWNRFNQLLRDGFDGRASVRSQLTDLVKSDDWKESSPGTEMFPGGERYMRAAQVQQKMVAYAQQKLFDEYPKLKRAIQFERRLKGAAIMSGNAGVQQVQQDFVNQAQ